MVSLKDKVDYEVRWYPFQLNSNAPREMSKLQAYMDKFGRGKEQTLAMAAGMKDTFTGAGLPFNFTEAGLTGNTFNGHRVMAYTYHKHGAAGQDKAAEILFDSYFNQELSPNDPTVLLNAAKASGLSDEESKKLVEDESFFAEETSEELAYGRKLRVSGVPFFVLGLEGVQKQLALSGAQPSDTFVKAIKDLCN